MRILLHGNSVHGVTGYSTQLKGIAKVLQSLGHEVAMQCTYGVQGGVLEIEGVPHYSSLRDMWAQDAVGHTVKHFGAEVLISLMDAWVLNDGLQEKAGVPWVCVSPIDSVPAAPRTIAVMKQARWPVTISQFGHDEALKAGLKSTLIPHGIDCDVFCPGDKATARAKFGLPADAFVVAFVGANKGYPSRKAIPEQLTAFAEFHKTHPESLLLLHTQKVPLGYWADGINIPQVVKELGLEGPNSPVYYTNEYLAAQNILNEEAVADIYRAADVLLHASCAEGFGLCIAECQAVGTPVITTDFSSMPELTFNGIKTVPLQRTWNVLGCWQTVPSVHRITDALESVCTGTVPMNASGFRLADSVTEIRNRYSWPVITERWRDLLDKIEAELDIMRSGRLESIPPEKIPDDFEAHFEELAASVPSLTDLIYRHDHDRQRFTDVVAAVGKFAPMEWLLEVGCCEGHMTKALAGLAKFVVGVDYSQTLLSRCPEIPNVTFQMVDVQYEPVPGEYDVIVASEILEHLRDPYAVIERLLAQCRVLIATCPITEPLQPDRAFDVGLVGHEMQQGDASGHIWSMDLNGFKKMFGGHTILEAREIANGVSGLVVVQGALAAEAVGAD